MAATRTVTTAPATGAPGLPGPGLVWVEQQPRAVLGTCTAWMQAGQECLQAALDCQQRMIALLTEHGTTGRPPDLAALQTGMTDLVLRATSEQVEACCRLRHELHATLASAIGTATADDTSSQADAAPTPPAGKPAAAALAA